MDKNSKPNLDVYGSAAVDQAYRILGFADLNTDSPNFGCFDRYYWHYRQVDFINSRFQEASHYLTLLYYYNHPQNRFYQNCNVYAWAKAAVDVWTQIQNPDGSFNEYWPFERSFCVTSFTLYASAETCRLLSFAPPKDHIHRTAKWLSKHENPDVLNQMAASAVALYISGEVLEDETVTGWATNRMNTILDMQHPDGYFAEYGGADIGYLTITLALLAKYYEQSKDERIPIAAEKACRYLDDKIEANGTYDNSNTSRKTQYIYPYGLCAFNEWDLASRHLKGLQNNEVLCPAWMDDRYCLQLATDYLQSAML